MGGVAKGLLPAPGESASLVERLIRTVRSSGLAVPVVFVGAASAYGMHGLVALSDTPPGIGPLGGLAALLARAALEGRPGALALACDLPFITPRLVYRLLTERPEALLLAPRSEGLWSALTARYSVDARDAIARAIEAREHSLQRLFARAGSRAVELSLEESERAELVDWDRPEDIGPAQSEHDTAEPPVDE